MSQHEQDALQAMLLAAHKQQQAISLMLDMIGELQHRVGVIELEAAWLAPSTKRWWQRG